MKDKQREYGLVKGTHGVIILEGKSMSMKKGDFLTEFSGALVNALTNSPLISDDGRLSPSVERTIDIPVTEDDPATAVLRITAPKTEERADWILEEVFWDDDTGKVPRAHSVWRWMRRQLSFSLKRWADRFVWADPGNNKSWNPRRDTAPDEKIRVSWLLSVVYWFKLLVVRGAVILAAFSPYLLRLVWSLRWIPIVKKSLRLDWGDVQRYVSEHEWAATARGKVEKAVIGQLETKDIEDVTIVAKSLGAVLAYEALFGKLNRIHDELKTRKKRLTLVTVGSALNWVLPMIRDERRDPGARSRFRFADADSGTAAAPCPDFESLGDNFFWLDIYARLDCVPAGPMADWIVKHAGVDPKKQVELRMVVNKDAFLTDHVSYWSNVADVVPRVIKCINGHRYPWKEAGITRAKLEHQLWKAFWALPI